MKSRALPVMLLVCSTVVASPGAQPGQLQVFRSTANAVAVDVTVQGRDRRPITGLTAADFEVLDNNVAQEVTDISYAKLPADITVALDVSYSVNGLMLERLRRGIVDLMKDFGPDDRLRLMLFNSKISRMVDFTENTSDVEAAMKGAIAGGGTALLDSLSVAVVGNQPAERRQLVVVFSDGLDSTSTTSPSMLSGVVLRSRPAIVFVLPANAAVPPNMTNPATEKVLPYSIANPNNILSPTNTLGSDAARSAATMAALAAKTAARPLDPLFKSVASATGGALVGTTSTSDLTAVFRAILAEFRAAYVVRYNVRGSDLAGYHTLEVKVRRDGAVVNARRGYWY